MTTVEIIITILVSLLVLAGISFLIYRGWKQHQDIRFCEEVIKKNSLTFYKAFSKISSKQKRHAIYAVYAFCRYADDVVDENQDVEALNQLEIELNRFADGQTPNQPMWRALRATTKRFYPNGYDYKPFYLMLQGQRQDLNHKGYQTLSELLSYCYLVAGTVGEMLLPILNPKRSNQFKQFAQSLGEALQITNILRDIGEDVQRNRIYLPQELLTKTNYTIEDLNNGKINPNFKELFEELANYAESNYQKTLEEVNQFDEDVRDPLAFSIILYRAILDEIRLNDYDIYNRRIMVSNEKKIALIHQYRKGKLTT